MTVVSAIYIAGAVTLNNYAHNYYTEIKKFALLAGFRSCGMALSH